MADKPISDADARKLFSALRQVMEYATRALSQSSALADLLVLKQVLTRAELDSAMRAIEPETKRLVARLAELAGEKERPS